MEYIEKEQKKGIKRNGTVQLPPKQKPLTNVNRRVEW